MRGHATGRLKPGGFRATGTARQGHGQSGEIRCRTHVHTLCLGHTRLVVADGQRVAGVKKHVHPVGSHPAVCRRRCVRARAPKCFSSPSFLRNLLRAGQRRRVTQQQVGGRGPAQGLRGIFDTARAMAESQNDGRAAFTSTLCQTLVPQSLLSTGHRARGRPLMTPRSLRRAANLTIVCNVANSYVCTASSSSPEPACWWVVLVAEARLSHGGDCHEDVSATAAFKRCSRWQ